MQEIGNDSQVALGCKVVGNELDILVDGTKDVAKYDDSGAVWVGGAFEIGRY